MNRERYSRPALKLALMFAVLFAVYRGGVELGKRRTHNKILAPIKRLFLPEESAVPVVWTSPYPNDPFGGDTIGADPFATEPVGLWDEDPFKQPAFESSRFDSSAGSANPP
jgi:hypothetical protein